LKLFEKDISFQQIDAGFGGRFLNAKQTEAIEVHSNSGALVQQDNALIQPMNPKTQSIQTRLTFGAASWFGFCPTNGFKRIGSRLSALCRLVLWLFAHDSVPFVRSLKP
jgi:hypothetical protein